MTASSHGLRGAMDGSADALVRAAPADVPAHRLIDLLVRRIRTAFQERGGGHELAGLAIAALGHAATEFRAGELEGIAQYPQDGRFGRHVHRAPAAVDREGDGHCRLDEKE